MRSLSIHENPEDHWASMKTRGSIIPTKLLDLEFIYLSFTNFYEKLQVLRLIVFPFLFLIPMEKNQVAYIYAYFLSDLKRFQPN